MISTSYPQWVVYPVPFYLILPLKFFSKLMLTCISNSCVCFHLRFHLPWFTCSPWGLTLNINQLAQTISWTQSIPLSCFCLPAYFLFNTSPCYCIEWLPQKQILWFCDHVQHMYWWHFIQLGKEWSHLEQGGKRKEEESRPHSLKTKSFNVLFPWEEMEKGGCGRQHISASCRHSWKWHSHGVSWVPPFLPLID